MPSALADKPRARSLDSFPSYSGSAIPSPTNLGVVNCNDDSPSSGLLIPSPEMERAASSTGGLSSNNSKDVSLNTSQLRSFANQLSSSLRSNRSSKSENQNHEDHNHFPLHPRHHHHCHGMGHQGNKREGWKSRSEFILMLIGYTVGLGNVWMFPSLCHKNGGASFLIPYGIMLALEGIPLYYMELCIGQKMRKGSVGVWNEISPYLGGVGIASVVVCFLVSLYYNVIIAWCVFYFFKSFQNPLPWSECPLEPVPLGNVTTMKPVLECTQTSPTKYFWYRTTLQISTGIEDSGGINWKLCACLVGTWILVWLCMMKGRRVTGKIVYVTATLPLILLIIFFFRGVHLQGYQEGLALLFIPEFNRLTDPLVWLDAAVQIFYSLGVAYGSLIAFSSYNPIKNDSTKDAITVCLINCATSIYASVVVFCFIGFQAEDKMQECLQTKKEQTMRLLNHTGMASTAHSFDLKMQGGPEHEILLNASKLFNETLITCNKTEYLMFPAGTGLAFIVFTEAINKMPFASLWSVMFFLMLITVGIDTEFGMLEGVVTPVIDQKLFPKLKKEYISGLVCLVCCLLGLPLVQYSGEYWVQLFIHYCSGIPLLIIALVECIAISYVYGIDRFSDDIKYMTNKPPRFIWRWCWKFISPVSIFAVLAMSIRAMSKDAPSYKTWDGEKGKTVPSPYPPWGKFLAICLTFVSIFFIPAVALLRYFRVIHKGTPELPAVVLDDSFHMNDLNSSERQPLHSGNDKPKNTKKMRKLSLARRKFRLEEKLVAESSPQTNKNGPLNRVITANGQLYQLVNQHNGAGMFV
ncbi:sodium- and chloride-dependent transporter XTRP3-like [Acropora millepora]|uniref:sodium- and chloride-dependent transporter XTRP3-like n=1 Tax=Acropora millepora TaxID=45264 RepID=UPI0010FCCF80|nr:sodium- and chloride-dependent transporter XTRP3-like [Acropora millepora]XP_029184478.1 sodium- and chloride-dependent transporter XTRP3-like [Acropora millepora]XP_029184479.1 sodium- and chloride-dependent transporter XTRP3-like [Acropora millepora]XP_029184480.1 sodium- and chloride-dependent transporter XTRP3-like [Acropora millepora]